jgi:hypothetical protein
MEDKKGNIWTSSESANYQGWTFSLYDGKSLSNDGWVLSRYDGNSLSNKKPTVIEIKPNKGMICGILEANDGSIWFGTLQRACIVMMELPLMTLKVKWLRNKYRCKWLGSKHY